MGDVVAAGVVAFPFLVASLLWASAASADLVQRFQHSDLRPSYHMRVAGLATPVWQCCYFYRAVVAVARVFVFCCLHHSLLLATALFARPLPFGASFNASCRALN